MMERNQTPNRDERPASGFPPSLGPLTGPVAHGWDAAVLAALRETLAGEIAQSEAMVAALEGKREILVSGKPPQGLLEADRTLMGLAQRAAQLEARRRELIRALAAEIVSGSAAMASELAFPVPSGKMCAPEQAPEPTLGELIARMPPECRPEFTRLRDRLLRAAHDVERLNRDNRDLLNLALHWIHDTVEVIASALTPEAASYDARARKRNFASGSLGAPPGPTPSTISHSA